MASKPWESSCFAACDHLPICCMTTWMPCVTYAHIQAVASEDGDTWSWYRACGTYAMYTALLMPCWVGGATRRSVRAKYGIEEAPLSDVYMHLPGITLFSLCQEARELRVWGRWGNGTAAAAFGKHTAAHLSPDSLPQPPQADTHAKPAPQQ